MSPKLHPLFFPRQTCLWFASIRQGPYDSYKSLCIGEKSLLDNALNISRISTKDFRDKPLI